MNAAAILQRSASLFQPVVPFDPAVDQLCPFDLTAANLELTAAIIADTAAFSSYIDQQLEKKKCRYGIGGYNEHRTIYARSTHFDTADEPRRLHLGVDIWGEAGTPVSVPLSGVIHSFRFNDHYGDYGATIILQHQLEDLTFYTLYGHLNLLSLTGLQAGTPVTGGQIIASFGSPAENGHWPPHLHFQVIIDLEGMNGDYPGVCKYSEREKYLTNCPDGDLILQMNRWLPVLL
jgi:murein DD-endopeptidase MepM/ murein hydrolase activator NlpD